VFVVWEPVLVIDVAPPGRGTLARVPDPRAAQYWDRSRALSRAIVTGLLEDGAGGPRQGVHSKTIVWDVIAVYAPGAVWDRHPPRPDWSGYPVVDAVGEFEERLSAIGAAKTMP
jgi:hypothetical protein